MSGFIRQTTGITLPGISTIHRGHYSCLCKQEHQLSSESRTKISADIHLAPFTHYLQVDSKCLLTKVSVFVAS